MKFIEKIREPDSTAELEKHISKHKTVFIKAILIEGPHNDLPRSSGGM